MKYRLIIYALILLSVTSWADSKDRLIADEYFKQRAFASAVTYYKKALDKEKTPTVIKNIIISYYKLNQYAKAKFYINSFYKYYKPTKEITLLEIKVNICLGNYANAKSTLSYYDTTYNDNSWEINKIRTSLDSIPVWVSSNQYKIRNAHIFNSPETDIAPVKYKKGLIFSSDRLGTVFKPSYSQTGRNFFNLYKSEKSEKGKWKRPLIFAEELNNQDNEGAACFNKDYSKIYFTRSEFTQKENINQSDANRLKLYMAEYKDEKWSKPFWFMLNDSLNSYGHPSISPDESAFFFVSDMEGGFGGTDIYVCFKINDSLWTEAINLGKEINTPGNELFPTISTKGDLYFTSNGHPGLGGYDIFQAQLLDGKWENVTNMGKGINSSYNDMSIYIEPSKTKGFFSSNRPGGKGNEDIYFFTK